MANPASSILAQTVTWNSITWNNEWGGPVGVEVDHSAAPVEDYTGADEYSRQVFTPRKRCEVRVILRQMPVTAIAAATSNMVVTYKTLASTRNRTFANMKFVGVRAVQNWGDLGSAAAVFVHQSTDGTTSPES